MTMPGDRPDKRIIPVDFQTGRRMDAREHFGSLQRRFHETRRAFQTEYLDLLPDMLFELQQIDMDLNHFEHVAGFLTNFHYFKSIGRGLGRVPKIFTEDDKKQFADFQLALAHWDAAIRKFSDRRTEWQRKFENLIEEARGVGGTQELIQEVDVCIGQISMRFEDSNMLVRRDFLKRLASYVSRVTGGTHP